MSTYLLSELAHHWESSDLLFGLTGTSAQPCCCLQNMESQPKGIEVCVLWLWVSEGGIQEESFANLILILDLQWGIWIIGPVLCMFEWGKGWVGLLFRSVKDYIAIPRGTEWISQWVWSVLRAISVSCSNKGSSGPSQVPWTCVVGLKFSMCAGKPGTEAVWNRGMPLLSDGWRGQILSPCSFGEEYNRARVNTSAPYKRLLQWTRTEGARRGRQNVQERCLSWSFRALPGWCCHHWSLWHTGVRQLSRLTSCCG